MPVRILNHGRTGLFRGLPLVPLDMTYGGLMNGEAFVVIEFLSKHVIPGTCVFATCKLVCILELLKQMFPQVHFCVVSFGIADEEYDPLHSMMGYRYSVDVCEALVNNYRRLYPRILLVCMGYDMSQQKTMYDIVKGYRSLLNFDVLDATDTGIIMYVSGDLVLPIGTGLCEAVLYLDCAYQTVCRTYDKQVLHEELCAFYLLDKGVINRDQYDNEVKDLILRDHSMRRYARVDHVYLKHLHGLLNCTR
jgi:cell division protein FtsL